MPGRNHRNRRRGSLEAQKLAAEAVDFLATETIRSKKKQGKSLVDPRPTNSADERTLRTENRNLEKDLAEANAKLAITRAALLASIKGGTEMVVQTERHMLADPTVATAEWVEEKTEEAKLDLTVRISREVLHLSHKQPGDWFPSNLAVAALEGIVTTKDFSYCNLATDENNMVNSEVQDVLKYRAYLTARMMDVDQLAGGDYGVYDGSRDYAAEVVALGASANGP